MGYELALANTERDMARSELGKITSIVSASSSSQSQITGLQRKVKEMEEEKEGWLEEKERLVSVGEAQRTQKEEK